MAEIEFSVMVSQCLKQRMPDQATLTTELAAYTHQRNDAKATVRWQFDVQQAVPSSVASILSYRSGEVLVHFRFLSLS